MVVQERRAADAVRAPSFVLLRGGAVGCLLLQRDVVLSRAGAGRTRPPRRRMPADHHTRHWVPFLCPDRARSGASVVVLLALGIPLRLRSWLSLLLLIVRRCHVARALRFSFLGEGLLINEGPRQ